MTKNTKLTKASKKAEASTTPTEKKAEVKPAVTDTNQYYTNDLLNRLVIPEWQWSIAVNQVVSGGGGEGGVSYATQLPMSLTDATFVYDRITALETSLTDDYSTTATNDTLYGSIDDVSANTTAITTLQEQTGADIDRSSSDTTSLDASLTALEARVTALEGA